MEEQPAPLKTKNQWANHLIALSTAVMTLATIAIGILAYLQWQEMKSGGEQTREMINAARKQADAAARFADTADDIGDNIDAAEKDFRDMAKSSENSVRAVQDSLRLDQRAWVTVDVGEKTGNFAVTMKNTGKTPALSVTAVTAFSVGKLGVVPEVDLSQNSSSPIRLPKNAPKEFLERLKKEGYIRNQPPTGYVIAPGATQFSSDYQGKFSQLFRIEGDRAYIQGRVTYDDVFGNPHETIFCYWFAPPSDFVMCNDHNKMN